MTVGGLAWSSGLAAAAEIVLASAAAFAGFAAFRRTGTEPADPESRGALLGLASVRLAVVALAGAPLFWLVLSGFVGAWPGVMCGRGVLRFGSQSEGLASFLPHLAGVSVGAKIVAVFAAGAARVLGGKSPVRGRAAWTLIAAAAAAIDGAAVLAWIVAPKADPNLSSGCCVAALVSDGDGDAVLSSAARTGWSAAQIAFSALSTFVAWLVWRRAATATSASKCWSAVSVVSATSAAAVSGVWAVRVLAPDRLGLPLHECGFCVLDRAPELWAGIALAAAAPIAAGWHALSPGSTRGIAGWSAFAAAGVLVLSLAERFA